MSLKTTIGKIAGRRQFCASSAVNSDDVWLPFTPNRNFLKDRPRDVSKGKGMYFYDENERPILDASAGLWCSGAGMSPDPIVDAVKQQMDKLSYAPSFQMTHEGAFEWAEAIANHGSLRNRDLTKVFFTMCGSTSVDTALKIALAYHRANGEGQRTRFIGREKGYHGVGFGGISVGGIVPNRQTFSACLLPGVDHLPHTHSLEHAAFTKGQPDWGCHLADNLEDIVALHGANNVAGVIVEPVAGSAGVLIPPKGYLERLRELCDKHNLLLIFDEVITGFGRLGGAPFAADYFDVTPDMITTAKNLTGAVVPGGAVIAKQGIFDTITNSAPENNIEFFHGYTYSAHPLACAAGMAMLKHLTEDGLYDKAASLVPHFESEIHNHFKDHPNVCDVRNLGLMGAIQLNPPAGWEPGQLGAAVMNHAWKHEDLYIRFTGDIIAFSPAFVATKDEISRIFEGTKSALNAVLQKQ